MTEPTASTRYELARIEAAAAWHVRMMDGPLDADEQAAFDTWKADSPENAKIFEIGESALREYDDPRVVATLYALRAEAMAARGADLAPGDDCEP